MPGSTPILPLGHIGAKTAGRRLVVTSASEAQSNRHRQGETPHMVDSSENKKTVLAFYNQAFNDRQPVEAVAEYVGKTYRQHNPQAQDGPVGFIQFVSVFFAQFPDASLEIKRVVAEGDLVVTHSLLKGAPDDRGTAVVDIFRLEEGKVVEHWEVHQPVPETSANDNPMV
jgi:predicted SnoaL-like aldol condensation-catalyzing enzyme